MSDQLFSVSGQHVLITGGSRGIGRAIAEGFAARGARVLICSRSQESVDTAVTEMQATGMSVTGQPEDMIGTAIFLAAKASAFMTGQTLYVDGGFSSGWNWPIPLS